MSYTAVLGIATELRVYDSGTDAYLAIPWIQSITGPGITNDTVEVTTLSSINRRKEYIAGLSDSDDVTFTLNWHDDEDTHAMLQTFVGTGEVVPFQLYWPQYTADNLVDFSGIVTGLSRSSDPAAQITRDCTIKVTGIEEVSTE